VTTSIRQAERTPTTTSGTNTVVTRAPLPQTSTFSEAVTGRPLYPRTQAGYDDLARANAATGVYATNYDGLTARSATTPTATLPTANLPTGGGSRGGGYTNPLVSNFGSYAEQVMKILRDRMGGLPAAEFGLAAPVDKLTPMVNQAVDADLDFARNTMGGVAQRSSDPWAGLQFAAQTFDPGTSGVLGAQGADAGVATAQQAAGQSDVDYTAQLFNNLARTMSANQQSSNDAWNADLQRDSAAVENDIGGQRTGLLAGAQIRQDEAQRQWDAQRFQFEQQERAAQQQRQDALTQAIIQLLSSGWNAGANVSGLDLGGF
jgi:hypothetical protein